ncbi:MAG: alpha/beta fold hydrolase [Paracoccaceae bacterium]
MSARFEAPDGRRLVYDDEGPSGEDAGAPPVLCLAGLTRDARDFAPLAEALADRFRVIRLDARGRGRSEHAADPMAEYQIAVEAGDAVALLDHLAIPRAVVIGTSRGGLQAMAIGVGARHRLAGVVLNDIGPVIEREGLDVIEGYIGVAPKAGSFDELAETLAHVFAETYPDFGPQDWRDTARRWFHEGEDGRPVLSYDPRLREPMLAGMPGEDTDLWPFFDAFEGVPLLAIRGARSNILSASTLAAMERRRPDMETVTLDNRGHVPILTEPDALAAIERFLTERVA